MKTTGAKRCLGGVVASAVAIAGCAPSPEFTKTQVRYVQVPNTTVTRIERTSKQPSVTLAALYVADGVEISGVQEYDCVEKRLSKQRRLVETTRKANVAGQAVFYPIGLVAAAFGSWMVADAKNVPPPNDPNLQNPFSRNVAYGVGGALLAVGTVGLGLAIGTSLRGIDSVDDEGTSEKVEGLTPLKCDRSAFAGKSLEVEGHFALGTTDERGRYLLTWKRLQDAVPKVEALGPTIQVVSTGGGVLTVDLASARTLWAKEYVASASILIESDEVDRAQELYERAKALGLDSTGLRRAIEEAPTSRAREKAERERLAAIEKARLERIRAMLSEARSQLRTRRYDDVLALADRIKAAGGTIEHDQLVEEVRSTRARQEERLWQQRIAECRKISAALKVINSMHSCDSACLQVQKTVQAKIVALKPVLSADSIAEDAKRKLQATCESAGCPTCPDGANSNGFE